jgi:anti-sigma regulatory factor (Ser/Thr protein kinase)
MGGTSPGVLTRGRALDVCWAAERGFDSNARAPSAARRWAGSSLRRAVAAPRDAEPVADAELVVSELVTNAIRSGAGSIRVSLQLHQGELEVDVADNGPGWPRLVRPGEQDAHGRGLILVDALADRWRSEPVDGGGKHVLVTIAVPAEFTRSLPCDRRSEGDAEREG